MDKNSVEHTDHNLDMKAYRDNPFRVPTNYFEGLDNHIMQLIDSQSSSQKTIASSKPASRNTLYYYITAAASLLVVFFSVLFYIRERSVPVAQNVQTVSVENDNSQDKSIDNAIDYAMMDSYDMYAYLADDH